LVPEGGDGLLGELARCSAAIQKQVSGDYAPIWAVDATVDAFARLEDVPLGYWPVIVMPDIQEPGALGYHTDRNGQPYALVQYQPGWELTASHETLEMLADPQGSRLSEGPSLKEGQGRVQYLVEVCDPCEAADFGYDVDGLLLSDFVTPSFFGAEAAAGTGFSFTDAVSKPREVLRGGYLTWYDPEGGHVWQERYFGAEPEIVDLGVFEPGTSFREQVDRVTLPARPPEGVAPAPARDDAREARADALRREIRALELRERLATPGQREAESLHDFAERRTRETAGE
jgi:hypothetical protein